jgi:hypothetical protein
MRLRGLLGPAAAALLAGCGTATQEPDQPVVPSAPVATFPAATPNVPKPQERQKAQADGDEARAIEEQEEERRRRLKKEREAKLEEQVKAEDVEAGVN